MLMQRQCQGEFQVLLLKFKKSSSFPRRISSTLQILNRVPRVLKLFSRIMLIFVNFNLLCLKVRTRRLIFRVNGCHSFIYPIAKQLSSSDQVQHEVQPQNSCQTEKIKVIISDIFRLILEQIVQSQKYAISQDKYYPFKNRVLILSFPKIEQEVYNQRYHHTLQVYLIFILVVGMASNQSRSTQQTDITQKLHPFAPVVVFLGLDAFVTDQLEKRQQHQDSQNDPWQQDIVHLYGRFVYIGQDEEGRTVGQGHVDPFYEAFQGRIHWLVLYSLVAAFLDRYEQECQPQDSGEYYSERKCESVCAKKISTGARVEKSPVELDYRSGQILREGLLSHNKSKEVRHLQKLKSAVVDPKEENDKRCNRQRNNRHYYSRSLIIADNSHSFSFPDNKYIFNCPPLALLLWMPNFSFNLFCLTTSALCKMNYQRIFGSQLKSFQIDKAIVWIIVQKRKCALFIGRYKIGQKLYLSWNKSARHGLLNLAYNFSFLRLNLQFIVFPAQNISMESKQQSLLPQHEGHDQPLPKEESISFISIFKFSNRTDRVYMAIGTVTSILAGITFPFFLMYFGQITDIFTDINTSEEKGRYILFEFLVIGSVYWILTFTALYCWSYSGSTQSMRLKKIYYQTLLEQEVAWYDSIDVGRLAAKVAKNISTIENAIGQKVALLISAIFTSCFGIIFAFVHCWQLSLFLTAVLPIIVYTGFLLMRSYGLKAKINNASYQKASGIAEQAFTAIKTVKYLVGEIFQVQKFRNALQKGNSRAVRYIAFASAFLAAFTFTQFGIYSLGMFLGKEILIWNLQTAKYTASDIVGTFFCMVSGGSAFGQISPILKNLAEGKQAFKELMSLIYRKKTLVQSKGSYKVKKIKKIVLKSISFKYTKVDEIEQQQQGNQILKNLTINFLDKKVNALVGESGSGKSTIVQLLMRYYDCTKGSITVNDRNIRTININNFRRKIGFVGQEPVLFAMTIQDNLRMADPNLTKEEIITALKKANAWEFVEKMEQGIETYVGANGAQLSGGQKQRIAIARALCKNPQILILDEATSALDRKNQKQIQQTLQRLSSSNITTIVVAHRLSTIKDADRIFVLDKGELVEQGRHEQLLSLKGIYAKLVHTQIQVQRKYLQEIDEVPTSSELLLQKRKSSAVDSMSDASIDQALENQKKKLQQEKNIKEQAVFRKLMGLSKKHYPWVLAGAASSLINGTMAPFFSMAFGNILALLADVTANQQQINYYCWFFFVIAIVASSTAFLYNFSFGMVGDRVVFDMRMRVFEKLLKLPMSYYDKKENTPGAISTKLSTEAYQIHNVITGIIAVVNLNSTAVICAVIIAIVHCWQIGLVSLAFTPILIMTSFIHISVVKSLTRKSERSEKFIGCLISDTVSNIRTVKSFGRAAFFINKFEENVQQLTKIAFQRSLKLSFFQGMRRATIVIVEGLVFWIAGLMYTKGVITDSSHSIFVALFAIIYAATTIGQNSQHMPDITRARRSGAILFDIIDTKDQSEMSLEQGGTLKDEIEGEIQFKKVSFKYPERDAIVLKDFSLKIGKNNKIGIVGESGSGKSTIIQLLMRIYPPFSGEIFIDGRNIKEYDLYNLRRQIGVVNQQPTLFMGTVKENILYDRTVAPQVLEEALKISCCSKFIDLWQEGLQKQVGQKGSQVSGGQKQRLAIARCLIREPNIILFDEATSALDADTQSSVFINLRPILSKRTSLSIAHRLSTIQDANWIIVLQDGRIIQHGSYAKLMQKKGIFYKQTKGK